jgi:8-amino-3,8-dideoxy-alpha-D-manno-octulosonate transaminase
MSDTAESQAAEPRLAIHGAPPARKHKGPPMYPGAMAIGVEEEESVLETLRSRRLFRYYGPEQGPSKARQLEEAFAAHLGARYAVGVNAGTTALMCGLQGLGVGPGDEVIVPAYTWIATPIAAAALGAVPVIAEVDDSLTLDPASVEANITPHTRAIIAVHMRGAPSRMDALRAIAQRHNLGLLEDVAQAAGASYQGQRLGTWGDAGAFSFQVNKIITAGEGGMVVTSDETLWKRAMQYHDTASGRMSGLSPDELMWGLNFRMPELLAAVLLPQLQKLDGLLAAMRANKAVLKQGLNEIAGRKGITFRELTDPAGDAGLALIFFLPEAARAAAVVEALRAENLGAMRLYEPERIDYHVYAHWVPIMEQRTWTPHSGPWRWAQREIRYHRDMCPQTLGLLERSVHLDVSPQLTGVDLEEMLEGLTRVLDVLA